MKIGVSGKGYKKWKIVHCGMRYEVEKIVGRPIQLEKLGLVGTDNWGLLWIVGRDIHLGS